MPPALDRFALLGISQGCAVSIAYAVRHPERVSHLVLFGGYPLGWARRARCRSAQPLQGNDGAETEKAGVAAGPFSSGLTPL